MNPPLRTRVAHFLARRLVDVMPPSRRDWALGMQAEIEAIEAPGEALGFAIGCARTACLRRAMSVSWALAMMKRSVVLGTVLLSGLAVVNALAFRLRAPDDALPPVLMVLGLAFLVAGLTLARFGPRPLVFIAGAMLALNTAGLWATDRISLFQGDVYQALVIEGYALWSALLGLGVVMALAGRSSRLTRAAARHGWEP